MFTFILYLLCTLDLVVCHDPVYCPSRHLLWAVRLSLCFHSVVPFLPPAIICHSSCFLTSFVFFPLFHWPCLCLCLLRPVCLCIFIYFSNQFVNFLFDPVCEFLSDLFVYFVIFPTPLWNILFLTMFVYIYIFFLPLFRSDSYFCPLPAAVSAPLPCRPPALLDFAADFCRPSDCLSALFDSTMFLVKNNNPTRYAQLPCAIGSQVLGLLLLCRCFTTYSWHSVSRRHWERPAVLLSSARYGFYESHIMDDHIQALLNKNRI